MKVLEEFLFRSHPPICLFLLTMAMLVRQSRPLISFWKGQSKDHSSIVFFRLPIGFRGEDLNVNVGQVKRKAHMFFQARWAKTPQHDGISILKSSCLKLLYRLQTNSGIIFGWSSTNLFVAIPFGKQHCL